MRLIVSLWHTGRWLSQLRTSLARCRTRTLALCSVLFLVASCLSPAQGSYMTNTVSTFLRAIRHLGHPKPGNLCSLDAQCSWASDLICASSGRCECSFGEWNGKQCALSIQNDTVLYEPGISDMGTDGQIDNSYCLPSEVEKNGKCYIRRKPGEACEYSEQCMNVGDIEYYCIANICQEPPECPPGFVAMGAECLPYSVTGGPCIHPSQCLTGSVCIKGKCRGPCDFNQLFLEESCVDYEGAGCIAMSCISSRCPRSFPSCNYITQKRDYLCCDRSMETKVQCPLPNSEPQIDRETGSVVECMHRPCMANYRCVFASYGRGKYICCSKPKVKPRDGDDLMTNEPDEYEENYGQQHQTTTKLPWVPPPPRPVQTPWTPQPIESARWTTSPPWTQNSNNWANYGSNNNWNTGNYGNWNGNYNNAQGWIANRGPQQPWGVNNGWNNYALTNQVWGVNPAWNNQQQWNYNGYANGNNVNAGAPVTQLRRRIIRPMKGIRTRSSVNRRPGSWSTFVQTWPKKQRARKMAQLGGRPVSQFENLQHPGYLNKSLVDQQPPASTLLRPSSTFVSAVSSMITDPPLRTGLVNAPWSYAVRVLILWCCTDRVCVYKDQLKEFCNRVVNAHIYAYHVDKNLQNFAATEADGEPEIFEKIDEPFVTKSFPIKKESKKQLM